MGNDNCGCLGGWPNGKPLMRNVQSWAYLPNIILHKIFGMIDEVDVLRAASVCRTWRQALYHPRFWTDVHFVLDPCNLEKCHYLSGSGSHLVRNAVISFQSLSNISICELATLLQRLTNNFNIQTVMFEPTHCRMQLPEQHDFFHLYIVKPLLQVCSRLEKLSLGCCEDMCQLTTQILEEMSQGSHANSVKVLGLASVKDDPGDYLILDCDPSLFQSFTSLQVLSVDYDYVSDLFLENLRGALQLKRLVVHVHGLWEGHPGTTDDAWSSFRDQHPYCELRLTLIHAYEAVCNMHEQILHRTMPLTHLKVFFCEDLNLAVLNLLSSWFAKTLRSIVWIDSQCQETSWDLIRRLGGPEANQPDPLVMAAWLCHELQEVVLLGYKYFEEDLVAIVRLRSDTLRNLEVADADIIYSHEEFMGLTDSKQEISRVLGRNWEPLRSSELHPVICNPTAGDSDEYLLPKVLADLY